MWLFELMGVALVAGVVVGVAWRSIEGFFEKRAWQQALEASEAKMAEQVTEATTKSE